MRDVAQEDHPAKQIRSAPLFRHRYILLTIILVLAVIGGRIVPDFGISYDEPTQRNHRLVNLNHMLTLVGAEFLMPPVEYEASEIEVYHGKYYGVVAQIPLLALDYFGVSSDSSLYWVLSHYYTHILFQLSVISMYILLKNLGFAKSTVLLGTLVYVLNPRIYAHSFYNIKDLVFLSLLTISLLLIQQYASSNSRRKLWLACVVFVLAVNSRVVGAVLFPFILLIIFLLNRTGVPRLISHASIAIMSSGLMFFIVTPILWQESILGLIQMLKTFSNYVIWAGTNVFWGEAISGNIVPRYYIPVWIAISVPMGHLLLWVAGLISWPFWAIKRVMASKKYDLQLIFTWFAFALISFSLLGIILRKSTLYNDWRHLYYLHVSFTILAAHLLHVIRSKHMLAYAVCIGCVVLSLMHTVSWMYRNHPHYYVYFNRLAGQNWDSMWDRDTWRLSAKQALELLSDSLDAPSTIYADRTVYTNYRILTPAQRLKLTTVEDIHEAEYFIADYRNVIGDYTAPDFTGFSPYHSVTVEGKPIMMVYKRD
ncbi:MAG TPA: hypothetical protein PKG71_03490 [Candidatus Woesebacteria bacterium]|nr:hypothetical protein [Candidatus Woesebacteria bacterium]HNS95006.1 hypothetical protein [Candidatus Woesebacteria bacterium]